MHHPLSHGVLLIIFDMFHRWADMAATVQQRWARSRSLILIFKITTGDLDLLGDLDHFQIDLDLLN